MAALNRINRIVRANCNDLTGKLKPAEGTAYIATGAATGAGVSATIGGMGLVGKFGGISIGMAPVAVAGAVAGAAAYGGKKALDDQDASALGAAAVGALGGAAVSSNVGSMGLAFAGTAVGVGMAQVAAAGAVVGLGAYGLNRLIDQAKTTDNPENFSASFAEIKLSIQQEIASLNKNKKLQQQQLKLAQSEVDLWQKVAIAALKQERDDLARKALERKLDHQQNITTITTQLEQVTARIESLKSDLLVIEMTINEV